MRLKSCTFLQFSSVQSLSHVRLFATSWTAAHQASLTITQLPQLTQTHVHWVGDTIQPSHPLLSPSPPAINLSQHQGFFKWGSSSNQMTKVLEFQLQHQSLQWIFRTVTSWPAYRFLKRQVRWSGIPISFRIFHTLLWSTQSKALA